MDSTSKSEEMIAQLIQEGNDEQLVRLIFALIDLDQGKIQERADLLTQLGERYVVLAASQSLKSDQASELTKSWCKEAIDSCSSAIKLIPTRRSYLCRALAYFMQNQDEEALADCECALRVNGERNTEVIS